jgi:uncharacterized phage-associated protein
MKEESYRSMDEKLFKYEVLDIAKHIMHMCETGNVQVNNTKLNKLLYVLYGVYLAAYNKPLFDKKPQYFPYGPVFADVFKSYDKISRHPLKIDLSEDPKIEKAINYTMKYFGGLQAEKLSAWSHEDGSPWDKVNKSGKKYGAELDDNDIYEYFNKNVLAG